MTAVFVAVAAPYTPYVQYILRLVLQPQLDCTADAKETGAADLGHLRLLVLIDEHSFAATVVAMYAYINMYIFPCIFMWCQEQVLVRM